MDGCNNARIRLKKISLDLKHNNQGIDHVLNT